MERTGGNLREFEHDADVGFDIEAKDLEQLFRLAAEALRRALGIFDFDSTDGKPESIELSRSDLGRLLVAWLRELLVGAQVERAAPHVRDVQVRPPADDHGRVGAWMLHGSVRWARSSEPSREVKAITYHDLRVERRGDGWSARVLFDV